MDFSSYIPFPDKRLGGSADYDAPVQIPMGLATICRNMRFRKESVRTRDGYLHTMSYADQNSAALVDVTGLEATDILVNNPGQLVVVLLSDGTLLQELPVGSGTLVQLGTPFSIPSGASMQTAKAYNRIYAAFSDLQTALCNPQVVDGPSQQVRPVSQNPVGAPWQPILYGVGDLVKSPDGRWWRCTVPGQATSVPPPWPTLNGYFYEATVASGNITHIGWVAGPLGVGTATATLDDVTGFQVGQTIVVAGALPPSFYNDKTVYDGTFVITAISGLNVSYQLIITELIIGGILGGLAAGTVVSTANDFSPSIIQDPNGPSQWEEWTPNAVQYLPAPDLVGSQPVITDNPGSGLIPASKDVYVKITFVIPETGESPRSAAVVFKGTAANDEITLTIGSPAGGPRIPRWLAEINLQPILFNPVLMNIYVAAVASGAAAPLDSAYGLFTSPPVPLSTQIIINQLPTQITTGQVSGGQVKIAGDGYTSAHVPLTFTGGGGGTGAAGFGVTAPIPGDPLNYKVVGIAITNGGSGYTAVPGMFLGTPPGGGVQATATAIVAQVPGGLPQSPYPAGAAISSLNPNAPAQWLGENGSRWMIVARLDTNESLSPVDPNSPIAVSFQGEVQQNILTITRTAAGLVTATVPDITGFQVGQTIQVQGCTGDATMNGIFTLTAVQGTLAPGGILRWTSAVAVASSDTTGAIFINAGPPPVVFLPPGGPYDLQDIAAFTVQGSGSAGPYDYIDESDPTLPNTIAIVSLQGFFSIQQTLTSISRFDGGYVQCGVPDISGFQIGMTVIVAATAGFPGMEGSFTLQNVEPTSGTAGNLYWTSSLTEAAGPCTAGTVTGYLGEEGAAAATLENATGLTAGANVEIVGASVGAFNGPTTLATVIGNVVTFPSVATGTATGGNMIVQQILPTDAAAVPQNATLISRDGVGNVSAQVPDVGGYSIGQAVQVSGTGTMDGLFLITAITINQDGVTGTIGWQQTGAAASSTSGVLAESPDFLINFDDNYLSNSLDITPQLTSMGAPASVDVYFSPSLNCMVYTKGQDSSHYFSNPGDPGNIANPDGILGVNQSNGERTRCFREMITGELISLKEKSGYSVTPGSTTPAEYGVSKRWDGHGPCGPRAVDLADDFLIYFDEDSGPYRYNEGRAMPVGLEKQGTWDRLTKSSSSQVCVCIDNIRKEVHFLVPLDGSTVPNHDLVLNYFNGWDEPLMLTMTGEMAPDPHGRRWSDNDCGTSGANARIVKVLKRTLISPPQVQILKRQLVFGLAGVVDGEAYVDMSVPNVSTTAPITDNGQAVAWQYQPAYAQSPTLETLLWDKMKLRAIGYGMLDIEPVTEDPTDEYESTDVDLSSGIPESGAVSFGEVVGSLFTILYSNALNGTPVAGAWMELHRSVRYGKVKTSGEPL